MSTKYDANHVEEDDNKPRLKRGKDGYLRRDDLLYEFDCPDCSANNPWGDGFADQAEIQCHYCGTDFRVTFLEGKKLKFKVI